MINQQIGLLLEKLYHSNLISFYIIFKYEDEKNGFTPVITTGIKEKLNSDKIVQSILTKIPHFFARAIYWRSKDEKLNLKNEISKYLIVLSTDDNRRFIFFNYDDFLVGLETNIDVRELFSKLNIFKEFQYEELQTKSVEVSEVLRTQELKEFENKISFLINVEEMINERINKLIELINSLNKAIRELKPLLAKREVLDIKEEKNSK